MRGLFIGSVSFAAFLCTWTAQSTADDPADALSSLVEPTLDDSEADRQRKTPRWTDLTEAAKDAARRQTGVFILFTADWCPWCRKQLKIFDRAEVAENLQDWTLAVIDVDQQPKIAKKSGAESLPTLQVQTADGRIVATQNGMMDAEELIAWLNEHRQTILLSGDDFAGAGPPDAATCERLLAQFQSRSSVARDAALRRLFAHRRVAALAVVKRLETGALQTRLAAVDLLGEWEAPTELIDPWRPDTITPEAISRLRNWAVQAESATEIPDSRP